LSPVIVKDDLPRLIAYPIGEGLLRQELGTALPGDRTAFYFLYLSGVQVNHYDPVISKEPRYPVLALDREAPQLCADTIARLEEQRRKKYELLHGDQPGSPGEMITHEFDCRLSVALFPVKARLRRKLEDAILDDGLRPMKNWLTAPPDVQAQQRPLVLVYDEATGKVSAKFAEPWEGKERVYR
jgi:hypothetical protein